MPARYPEIPDGATPLDLLTTVIDWSDIIYLKKLAVNDWQWADKPNAHQNGVFIPHVDRDYGFFPRLTTKHRPGEAPIHEAFFDIFWLTANEIKEARLVHYTSKGQETHLTRVIKSVFAGLPPASILVIGRKDECEILLYSGVIVPSDSEEYDFLVDLFGLDSSFLSGFFEPEKARQEYMDEFTSFVDQALYAFRQGVLPAFITKNTTAMPSTSEMAALARQRYMGARGLVTLDPFGLEAPGNILLEISRDEEFKLFKEYELRMRSMQLASVIVMDNSGSINSVEKVLASLISRFPDIDKILLSASQSRKSRAGYSFEHHIGFMLASGKIPFEAQVVIEDKKRPDFVLPTFTLYMDKGRSDVPALVLSAKTTLRERWKQVLRESKNCTLFLATVDDSIAGNAIEDMNSIGIVLVVPENLKEAKTTVYEPYRNVITFRDFFRDELKRKRFPVWEKMGLFAGRL